MVAKRVLENITDSAVNAGKQMLNSLTLEPVKQGFSEYELKLDSVQTIMASTGESLETVNGYLQELNTYADKTIYSFSDMTASIGKFTNSGVKLEDAVKAIQGISNEAAVSGANAQQASHAMYNFAQALSSGSVKLIDWKSIENANMATVEFKNELIKTAVELGTVVKEGDKFVSVTEDAKGNVSEAFTATSMFNDSLSSNWMTSEVLVKTLAKYSDETNELGEKAFAAAQDVKTFSQLMDTLQEAVGSGWATTWEIIFGDFEEAKKLWTSVSNIVGGFIDSQSDARNSLLQEWKDMGGRAALIEAFKNAFKGFKEIIVPVKEAFTNIFPPITAKRLTEISEKLRKLTADFKISKELARNLRIGFSELFKSAKNVFEGIKRVAYMLYGAFDTIFPKVEITGKKFREIARTVRVFTDKIKSSYEANATLNKILLGLCSAADIVLRALSALFKLIKPLAGGIAFLTDKIFAAVGIVGVWLAKLDAWIQENDIFNKSIQQMQNWITSTAVTIKQFFLTLKEKLHIPGMAEIKEALGKILQTADKKIKAPGLKLVNSVLEEIGKKLSYIKQIAHNVFSAIGNAIDALKKKLSNVHLTDSLSKLWDITKQVAKGISKVIVNLFKSLGNIDFQKVLTVLNDFALGGMAIAIVNFFRSLSKPIKDVGDGISEIASFPKRLTEIFNSIKGAFTNISGVLDDVKNTLQAYQTQLKANTLMKIAFAIGILSASIIALSFVDEEKLSDALGAMTLMFGDLMASMAVFVKISGNMSNAEKASFAMIAMSFAILILASAMKKTADMGWEDIAKGLSSFVVMLYFMTESVNRMAGKEGAVKSCAALILMSIALNKVAKALKKVAEMEWEEIAKGLSGLVIALYFMVESMNRIDGGVFNDKKFISIGISLILVGTALKIVAKALKTMGSMSWEEVAKGLSALVGSLS